VRPSQGRLLAGVCGAFGRATNTDPILWRVIIAVLTIFAGIGALIYLVAWLVLPADGDTASPIEALAGRGRSGTSTALTIIGSIIAVFALAAYVSEPFRATPLLAMFLLGGVLLLLLRDQRGRARPVGAPTTEAGYAAAAMGPPTTYQPAAPPAYAMSSAPYPPAPAAGTSSLPPFAPPPFAPHGPFVPPPPPPPPPPAPPMVRPPKPRSKLGGLMLSVILLAVGALAVVNLAGYHVPPSAFLATALGLVGVGLLIGTWFGRARGLIVLGILLSIVLSGGLVAGWDSPRGWWNQAGTATWAPASVEAVQREYRQGIGDATLDLSKVDFSESDIVTIDIAVDLGTLKIKVPSSVDVTVNAQVDVGDASVFQEKWDGLGQSARTITDLGEDGPGGGRLNINAKVDVGELEVTR
jgi:phage shock protein PspC (stress-responsive transcriptional regulator)